MTRYKDIDGEIFGRYQIIGDTGKRGHSGGMIVIARNLETGKLHEGLIDNFKRGHNTGYIGSAEHTNIVKKRLKDSKKTGIHELHFTDNYSTNKTNYKGVSFYKQKLVWKASVIIEGTNHIKYFKNFKDAVLFINELKREKLNPLINNKSKKFKKIDRNEIYINDYVKKNQKLINRKSNEIGSDINQYFARKNIQNGKGYSWNKRQQKWVAYITINKKRKSLGSFTNKQDAIAARQEAVEKYFNTKGEF